MCQYGNETSDNCDEIYGVFDSLSKFKALLRQLDGLNKQDSSTFEID